MYRFEAKLKAAEDRGIEFSEGQKTYLRCARINGIDLLDHLYERYTQEYMIHQKEEGSAEYLSVIGIILSISEFFDNNLCELVDKMIDQNTVEERR